MTALNQIGQISLTVNDVDAAETFYENTLGLRKLYRHGDLLFFDCAGLRLMLSKSETDESNALGSTLYFRTDDIIATHDDLQAKGVQFTDVPHLVAPMDDHDLWMVFFQDPSGNPLALMYKAPKDWTPPQGY